MIAVIKSKSQYEEVLARIIELASDDPVLDSAEGKELELLSLLVKDYEQ
jgi:antitoxin component HigA of HigAB toxin-antitoxin module